MVQFVVSAGVQVLHGCMLHVIVVESSRWAVGGKEAAP